MVVVEWRRSIQLNILAMGECTMVRPLTLITLTLFCLSSSVPSSLAGDQSDEASPEPSDMKSIFNGKDLIELDSDPRFWSVKDARFEARELPTMRERQRLGVRCACKCAPSRCEFTQLQRARRPCNGHLHNDGANIEEAGHLCLCLPP